MVARVEQAARSVRPGRCLLRPPFAGPISCSVTGSIPKRSPPSTVTCPKRCSRRRSRRDRQYQTTARVPPKAVAWLLVYAFQVRYPCDIHTHTELRVRKGVHRDREQFRGLG